MALLIGEDFPLVCESCLGGNPYVRMVKSVNGTECKISKRPCTMFEWRVNGVKKQTCVAYAVAAQKNICQCCMTDLTFGLPVNVRDAFMKKALEKGFAGVNETFGTLPQSQVGKDYYFNQLEDARASAEAGTLLLKDDSAEAVSSLMKGALAHTQSFESYGFRIPEICSGWVNGECKQLKRGGCGKRPCCGLFKFPELPSRLADRLEADLKARGSEAVHPEGEIKSRLVEKASGSRDSTKSKVDVVKTLFVSNLASDVDETTLKSVFSRFPGVVKVNLVAKTQLPHQGKIGFVEFETREAAQFVLSLSGIQIGSGSAQFAWARPKGENDSRRDEPDPREHLESRKRYRKEDGERSRQDDRGKREGGHRGADRRQVSHSNEDAHSHPVERSEIEASRSFDAGGAKVPAGTVATSKAAAAAVAAALQLRKARGLDDD